MIVAIQKIQRDESFTSSFRRSLKINTTTRFNAAKRLRHHENFSLWSISLASLLLLFIPLFKPFGVTVKLSDGVVNIAQVIAAGIILIVSIIASGCKFGERASKMHSDGVKINSIYRRFDLYTEKGTVESELAGLVAAYEDIIENSENHEDIDFAFSQIKRMPDYYGVKKFKIIKTYIVYALIFSPYLIMVLSEVIFIYLMVA